MRQLGYPGAEEGILGIDMDPRPVSAVAGQVSGILALGSFDQLLTCPRWPDR